MFESRNAQLILLFVASAVILTAAFYLKGRGKVTKKGYYRVPFLYLVLALFALVISLGLIYLGVIGNSPNRLNEILRSGVMALISLGIIFYYFNWFFEVKLDRVRQRNLFGQVTEIAYKDIQSYEVKKNFKSRSIKILSKDGKRIYFTPDSHDATPLILYLEYREKHRKWPSANKSMADLVRELHPEWDSEKALEDFL